ncbi:MAG: hypothetical protein J7539_12860 [Niabella sp.]|nr:hypothetical protein [Niabella sp.]
MKFRRSIFLFIIGIILIAYFTKPSKERFIAFIQPANHQVPPVVDYQDKFLYASVTAIYVDAQNPVTEAGHLVAPARKETYIGLLGKYWKLD